MLDQREVIHVDIAYDELSSGEYREDLVGQLYTHNFVPLLICMWKSYRVGTL